MRTATLLIVSVGMISCGGKAESPDGVEAAAQEVCDCKDEECASTATQKFRKLTVSLGPQGEAQHRVKMCNAKLRNAALTVKIEEEARKEQAAKEAWQKALVADPMKLLQARYTGANLDNNAFVELAFSAGNIVATRHSASKREFHSAHKDGEQDTSANKESSVCTFAMGKLSSSSYELRTSCNGWLRGCYGLRFTLKPGWETLLVTASLGGGEWSPSSTWGRCGALAMLQAKTPKLAKEGCAALVGSWAAENEADTAWCQTGCVFEKQDRLSKHLIIAERIVKMASVEATFNKGSIGSQYGYWIGWNTKAAVEVDGGCVFEVHSTVAGQGFEGPNPYAVVKKLKLKRVSGGLELEIEAEDPKTMPCKRRGCDRRRDRELRKALPGWLKSLSGSFWKPVSSEEAGTVSSEAVYK